MLAPPFDYKAPFITFRPLIKFSAATALTQQQASLYILPRAAVGYYQMLRPPLMIFNARGRHDAIESFRA